MARATRMRSRSISTTTAAAAAAVLALGAAGCSIDLSHWRPGAGPEPSPSPTPVTAGPVLETALAALEESPAIQLQGQFSEPGDTAEPVETTVTVTDSGATSGTFQSGTSEARYIEADRTLFIDADDAYWLTAGVFNPDSDVYAEHWVRSTPAQLGLDPGAVLAPGALAESLRAQAPAEDAQATEEKLDGAVAYRIDLTGGTVWVTAEEPHQLIRMQLEELAPADGEGVASKIAADFTPVETEAVEQLYTDLTAIAEDELGSARDARIEIGWTEELSMNCETGGVCTISGTAGDLGDAPGGSVRVRLDALFENSELGERECDNTGTLDAGGTVELSCSTNYDLAPSANPQTYEVNGNGSLSTRALSGDAREELVQILGEQREATLSGDTPQASPSEGN